jgi:hypothetical protein
MGNAAAPLTYLRGPALAFQRGGIDAGLGRWLRFILGAVLFSEAFDFVQDHGLDVQVFVLIQNGGNERTGFLLLTFGAFVALVAFVGLMAGVGFRLGFFQRIRKCGEGKWRRFHAPFQLRRVGRCFHFRMMNRSVRNGVIERKVLGLV